MTIQLIHIHAFKCAGTTFALNLATNFGSKFMCVDPVNRNTRFRLEQVEENPLLQDIEVISSHTIIAPRPSADAPIIVGFIREPNSRLYSAWHFYRLQENLPEFPFSAYLARQSHIKNYQSRIFSYQPDHADSSKNWELSTHEITFGGRFFIGVVERYTESMVVIEYLLSNAGISFKGDVSSKENMLSIAKIEPDVSIPSDFVDFDKILYERCNSVLDAYRQIIPDFAIRLAEIQNRVNNRSDQEKYRHLLDRENHLIVDQVLVV